MQEELYDLMMMTGDRDDWRMPVFCEMSLFILPGIFLFFCRWEMATSGGERKGE